MAAAQPAKQGLSALLKRGWNEIPDVIGGSVMAIIGLGLVGIGIANYHRKDGDNRRYKIDYVVMRPDDPRAANVHKD